MSSFFLLNLLLAILAYSSGHLVDYWAQRSNVQITLKPRYSCCTYPTRSDVDALFEDYGKKIGLPVSDMEIREIGRCPSDSYARKYDAFVMDCDGFQRHLYHLRPSTYLNIGMAHVECGHIASSICLKYFCTKKQYADVASDAYNCTK